MLKICEDFANEFEIETDIIYKYAELVLADDKNNVYKLIAFSMAVSFAIDDIKYANKRNMFSSQFRYYYNRIMHELNMSEHVLQAQDNETFEQTNDDVIQYITRTCFMLRNLIHFDSAN